MQKPVQYVNHAFVDSSDDERINVNLQNHDNLDQSAGNSLPNSSNNKKKTLKKTYFHKKIEKGRVFLIIPLNNNKNILFNYLLNYILKTIFSKNCNVLDKKTETIKGKLNVYD